jgi:hypothetical protein
MKRSALVNLKLYAMTAGVLMAGGLSGHAQERTGQTPVTPLKVQVVLSRYDGDKRLASMPYTLLVNAGERDNRLTLRMGVALPITGVGKDGPTVTVHDIGTNMDCTALPAEGGRFRINLAVNHTSVYESDQKHLQATTPRPGDSAQLIRSFTSSFSLNLRDGETGQSIAATDPVTGEVMKIDVTLTVMKQS